MTGTVLVFRDVTEKRSQEKALSWQASHDQLTGLINRREFENRLKNILKSKLEKRQHALCYIDLDHFKVVNDCCGHLAGDKLLTNISDRLKSKTRDTDTLARLGGDEFGLILYSCGIDKALNLAEIVRQEVEAIDFVWQGKTYKVSASIGIIAINHQLDEIDDVLRSADMACYKAKAEGRNRINIIELDENQIEKNHTDIKRTENIRQCINEKSFILFEQHITPLDGANENQLYDLLIRGSLESNQLIKNAELFATANQFNLVPTLDQWLLDKTADLILLEDDKNIDAGRYCLNISEQSISDNKFLEKALFHLVQNNQLAHKLCLTIPDSALLNHNTETRLFIQQMKEHGFKIILDNFYSSLESFKRVKTLDIDYIKFEGYLSNKDIDLEYKILQSMNEICHHMGIQTIAKNIDSRDNLEALYKIGIDYAQGAYIGLPVKIDFY